MKKRSFIAVFLSCLMLHISHADEMGMSPASMDIQTRLSKLQELKKADKLSKQKRALEDLMCDIGECQELVNIQNQFISEMRAFSLDLKQGVQTAQSIKEFKAKNCGVVEEVFGKKEAALFKKVVDLLPEQPYDVQASLVNAVIKSLGYPVHDHTKDLRQKQKSAQLMAKQCPEMEMQVSF